MRVTYIVQPDLQVGGILKALFDATTSPRRIVFVSAFVGLQTLTRVKPDILRLKQRNTEIRFVFGIDLGGTSQEALSEVLSWGIDCQIFKNRRPGHTFHPKLYLFEWLNKATIIIGSNNMTDGGFFGNYECAVRITYDFPVDEESFADACGQLKRFLDPSGAVSKTLTRELLQQLIDISAVPTEEEARRRRGSSRKNITGKKPEAIFGTEFIPPPPPLSAEHLGGLIKDVRKRQSDAKKAGEKVTNNERSDESIDRVLGDPIHAEAFYMTLPTLQGKNIPGEGRIPLEALRLATEFWGWRDQYSRIESPRAGHDRVYWEWRPRWRFWNTSSIEDATTQEVRMYLYENSSDFRFYIRPLVDAGADLGDVIRIRRIEEPDAEFECILAIKGTPEYDEWIKSCTQPVKNSSRRYGYA